MKSYTKILSVASLAVAMLVGTANATLITGTVAFFGVANLDNSNLALATQVVSAPNVYTGTANGSFAVLPFASVVAFNAPWSFSYAGPSTTLWSVGGFTFNLDSSSIVSQSSTFLNVVGTGWLTAAGYETTRGEWSFTIPGSGNGVQFTFASSTTAVPDGGMTALLLGAGLLSLGFAARRKNA